MTELYTEKQQTAANTIERWWIQKKSEIMQRILHQGISAIEDGYIIESRELDGCDDMGEKYWVSCRNGYYGREWEITSKINKDTHKFLQQFCEEYDIEPLSTYITKRVINLITKENKSRNIELTKSIVSKIQTTAVEFYKPNYNPWLEEQKPILTSDQYQFITDYLELALRTSGSDFLRSIDYLTRYAYGRVSLQDIKTFILSYVELTHKEEEYLLFEN